MMKKFLIALMILLATTTCHAKSVDDLDAAQVRLVCAICSFDTHGWQIEKIFGDNLT